MQNVSPQRSLIDRLRLLEQATVQFPGDDFSAECHALIDEIEATSDTTGDVREILDRARRAASRGATRGVIRYLRDMLTASLSI